MDWDKLCSSDNNAEHFASQCKTVLQSSLAPWRTLASSLDPRLSQAVMDVLQIELDSDDVSSSDYRMKCLRCLRVLGENFDVVPSSFFCRSAKKLEDHLEPLCGGGFADIWKGSMGKRTVSLKVLRTFSGVKNASKLFKDCRGEALIWRQLRHPSILPFFGVNDELFAPRLCLISPWLGNGNLVEFLQRNPGHNRMKAILEIAEGIQYLHHLDPPVVHSDIKGANVLVKNDLSCCLADFGLALVAESHSPGSSAMNLRGTLRWLPPEILDYSLFDNNHVTAVDIYSFGCTIIEILSGEPPFSHIKRDAAVINEVLIGKRIPRRPSTDLFHSDKLWFLIASCLSYTAKDRPTINCVISSLRDLDSDAALHMQSSLHRRFHGQTASEDCASILCRRRVQDQSITYILEAGEQHDVTVGSEYEIFEHDLLDDPSTVFEVARVKSTSDFTSVLELVHSSDAFLGDNTSVHVDTPEDASSLTVTPTSPPNRSFPPAWNLSEGLRYAYLSKDAGARLRVYCIDIAYIQSVLEVHTGDKGSIIVVDKYNEAELVVSLESGKVTFDRGPHTKVIESPIAAARGVSTSLSGTVPHGTSESSLHCTRSVIASYGWFLRHLKRTEWPRNRKRSLELSFQRLFKTSGNYEPDGENLLDENSDTVTIIPNEESFYGFTLRNLTEDPLFVHVFLFNPETTEIVLWYRPPQITGYVDQTYAALKPGCTLTPGFGNSGVHPLCSAPQGDKLTDVTILKIFASTSPSDMSFVAQPSPFKGAAFLDDDKTPSGKLSVAHFSDSSPAGTVRAVVTKTPEELILPTPAAFWTTQSITIIRTALSASEPPRTGRHTPSPFVRLVTFVTMAQRLKRWARRLLPLGANE